MMMVVMMMVMEMVMVIDDDDITTMIMNRIAIPCLCHNSVSLVSEVPILEHF